MSPNTTPQVEEARRSRDGCVALYRYRVPPERTAAFEAAYGPDGDWARLYREAPGYLGTELWRDPAAPGAYLLADRWASAADRDAGIGLLGERYRALDRRCADLHEQEELLGVLDAV